MNRNTIFGAIVGILLVGGAAFYAGMTYAKGQAPGGNFSGGQFAGAAGQMTRGSKTNTGFASGQIVSVDSSGITIKLQSGSTQIVVMGTSTEILKTAKGTISDFSSGTEIVVTGTTNTDGSLTAKSIQIRPAGVGGTMPGGRPAQTR